MAVGALAYITIPVIGKIPEANQVRNVLRLKWLKAVRRIVYEDKRWLR